jgi:hypothetical protein
MKKKLLAVSCLLLAVFSYRAPRAVIAETAPAPCVAGRTAAPVGFWTWPANSRVNVYLREPDFAEADTPAIRIAVQNWDAAAAENGSNVRFSFRGLTKETRVAKGDLTLVRGAVYNKKQRHLALLEAHSLRSDQLIDYALVIVDPRVREANVLTNVMAHEIGHSLGLLDCYHCHNGSTAMGLLKSADESNGIEGPTACDKTAVLAAYQELKLHVGRAPEPLQSTASADNGEESEEDDTPIVPEAIAPGKPQTSPASMPGRAGRPRSQ